MRGTYRIACESCKKELFATTGCPMCNAEGGVDRALNEADPAPLAVTCNACGGDLLVATAFVPALVVYEGKRPNKPRPQAVPEEPEFHMTRIRVQDVPRSHRAPRPVPALRAVTPVNSAARAAPSKARCVKSPRVVETCAGRPMPIHSRATR